MKMLLKFAFIIAFSIIVDAQDLEGTDLQSALFKTAISSLISKWGNVSTEDYKNIFEKFKNNGLHHIWNELGDHCSSNIECGPDACCIQPHMTGKRATSDGSKIHFGSYCAKLRNNGETCSKYDKKQHHFQFQCPCSENLECVSERVINLHPLIKIPINSICKPAV